MDEELPSKRRKLRKGTHSCIDCRRRKVRCIFASPHDAGCITCRRRGIACVSQVDVDGIQPLSSAEGTAPSSTGTAESFSPRPPSVPAVRLPPSPASDIAPLLDSKQEAARRRLLQAIPCSNDLNKLRGNISNIIALRHQTRFQNQRLTRGTPSEVDVLKLDLSHLESHPVLLARQMLMFATALRCRPSREVFPGLSKHHHTIADDLAEAAIATMANNDAMVGSLEGLETLVVESFFHIDCGNIRRSWLANRRAVGVAQLLRLHRAGHARCKTINDKITVEPATLWAVVVAMERLISLLLVLPTSTGTVKLIERKGTSDLVDPDKIYMILADVAGTILERNDIGPSLQALQMTDEIDRYLLRLAEEMPLEFWQPPIFAGMERDSIDAFCEMRRCFEHMYYYTLVIQLHLPHMLCPNDTARNLYARMACANASREILVRKTTLRTHKPISVTCWISDFMALVAGLTLMLAHVVSHIGQDGTNVLKHHRLSDRATIERTLECLDSTGDSREEAFHDICAEVLRSLMAVEAEAAHHSSEENTATERSMITIEVPCLGTVRISRAGCVVVPPSSPADPNNHSSESLTIGGIGSISVDKGGTPTNTPSTEDTSTTEVSGSYTPWSTVLHPDGITELQQILYEPGRSCFGAEMFPNATAGVDDWALQGLDTAFFDVLFQNQQPGWNASL